MIGGGEGYWYPEGDTGMIPNEVPDEERSLGEDEPGRGGQASWLRVRV